MTHNSIDLTGVPGFKADGPAAMHHPEPTGNDIAELAIWCGLIGLVGTLAGGGAYLAAKWALHTAGVVP